MALEHQQTMTVEEYFQLEENDPDTRYEYIDGHVYAMAGGTANHDTIKSNIQRILWNLLRGSTCRVYSSDSQSFKIEIYHKEQNKWIYDAFENTDEITLSSLGVHFSLADAYTDVEFEETTEEA
jgi:Uma2 family endonuclease